MAFYDDIDLSKLSAYLSGAAKSSAEGNIAEGNYLNARDRTKAELYGIQQAASTRAADQALANAKFTTALPAQGYGEAVRGSLLQNMQDVTPIYGGASGHTLLGYSGGARPSALGPEARAAGGALAAHGTSLLANPNSFLPSTGGPIAPPTLSEEPAAGFWGKAASAGATGAGLANALLGGDNKSNIPLQKLLDLFRGKGPKPGDPDFMGPVDQPGYDTSWPGDDNFMGPYDPGPKPGDPNFMGPVQPFDPENPASANTDWWKDLPLTDEGGNGGGGNDGPESWWHE